jgi:hypothetical protein
LLAGVLVCAAPVLAGTAHAARLVGAPAKSSTLPAGSGDTNGHKVAHANRPKGFDALDATAVDALIASAGCAFVVVCRSRRRSTTA